jgi:hypothetical protein
VCGNLTVDGGIAMSGDFSIFGTDNSFNVVCDEIMLDASQVDICGNVTVSGSVAVLADPPSSANDTGTTGEIRVDDVYIYVCTATNTWKRVSVNSWP